MAGNLEAVTHLYNWSKIHFWLRQAQDALVNAKGFTLDNCTRGQCDQLLGQLIPLLAEAKAQVECHQTPT